MLRLGVPVEVPPDEGSSKKRIERPPSVRHFHDNVSPSHFCKILMASGIGVLPLPDGFMPYLGPVPGKMIVKTTTGCQWEMSVKEVSGKAVLEAGWPEFAVAHNLKIGDLLFFKKPSPTTSRSASSSSSRSSARRSTGWSSSTTPAVRLLAGARNTLVA
jgi:hypothetical protein